MSTILVPLDGSPLAEQALSHACRLARAAGSRLLLMRAAVPVFDPEAGVASRSSVQHAEAYLNVVRDRVLGDGLTVDVVSLFSNPVPGILRVARMHAVSTIVMSTHGRTGLRRMVLGSVTEQVVQESLAPVLIVNGDSPSAPAEGWYRRILVSLDGSTFAEAALDALKDLHLGKDVEVVLLQSVQAPHSEGPYSQRLVHELDRRCDSVRDYLERVAASTMEGYSCRLLAPVEHPATAILAAVEAQQVDLIIIATHARYGRARFSQTSVAGQVLRETGTPVLIVRGADEAAEMADTTLPIVEQSEREEDSYFNDCLLSPAGRVDMPC
jgi:nucleotide-binding universal stress UspA family protein